MRLTTAVAPAFSFTGHTFAFDLAASGPYTATLATGTRYVNLGASSADLVRLTAAAMTAAPGLPGGVSFAATMADTGLVSITCTGDTWKSSGGSALSTTLAGRILGFPSLGTLAATQTATTPPWYLALFSSAFGGVWAPQQGGGVEETAGGSAFAFASSVTAYRRELRCAFIPSNPTEVTAIGTAGTPMWPADSYYDNLGETDTARAWSLLDVLYAARNADCGIAIGTWDTVRASTSETFRVGRVGRGSLLSPEIRRADDVWPRYVEHTLHLVTAGTMATRA